MGKKRDRSELLHLASLLPEALGEEGGSDLTRVSLWWFRSVPAKFRHVSCPVDVRDGTVWVNVDNSSSWQELEFVRAELLRTMRIALRDLGLRELRFRLAESR